MKSEPKTAVNGLLGKAPWGVTLGFEKMLTMEFGSEDPRQSSVKSHGEWHLWLYMCSWRIESGSGQILVASEDEADTIAAWLAEVDWTEVDSVELQEPSFDLLITFKNHNVLRTFSVNASSDHEAKQWILFLPQMISLSARGNLLTLEESGPKTGTQRTLPRKKIRRTSGR